MDTRSDLYLPRRQVLRGLLTTATFAATANLGTGCTQPGNDNGTAPSGAKQSLVLGFIYVGAKDDFGWNQSHAEGKAGAAQKSGVRAIEQENVPETIEVQNVIRNMIEQDGATVLFPTSFGYFDPHILKMAVEYPEVQFFHCGTLWRSGMPPNIGSYYADIDDAQFVAGRVAAQTSKTGKLGFIAAKPITPVLRNLNSFVLGARSVRPNITLRVIFTGNWSLPLKEADATNSLADQGIDVVGMHVDSPKVVIETAKKRGIFTSGYHVIQSSLAPKQYLTGAAWDWSRVYTNYVEMIKAGKTLMNGGIPHLLRGGLQENFAKLAPYGSAVTAATRQDAEATKAKLLNGSLTVYTGAIASNTGEVKIPAGTTYKLADPVLDKMDWLAEGVIGSMS